jgi:hypothetical protein
VGAGHEPGGENGPVAEPANEAADGTK